jgi:hypothetical protein
MGVEAGGEHTRSQAAQRALIKMTAFGGNPEPMTGSSAALQQEGCVGRVTHCSLAAARLLLKV